MRAAVLSTALLIVTAVPVRHARCQQPPATIPTELALVLLDHGETLSGNRAPKIIIGRAPDGIPRSLTSADGAVIVGGIEYPQVAIVVLAFTLPPSQVLKAYDKHMLAAGWKTPPPWPTEGSGFVSTGPSFDWGNVYCADSGAVKVEFLPAPNGGTYLKVENIRNTQRSFCAPRDPMMVRGPSFKFPALRPPTGMTQRGGGGGSGGDNAETSARMMGVLDPPDLVAHYVRQLDSAGWKMGATATSGGAAIAPAEAKDSAGVRWTGALTAWRISPVEVEVTIKMARPSQR
jgi:hypothetical protein